MAATDQPIMICPESEPQPKRSEPRMPTIFIAHGAPMLLDDPLWVEQLANWGRALPTPTNILMVSAHWERKPVAIGTTETAPLVYDFYGFPQRYYEVQYQPPGAPALAATLRGLLNQHGIESVEEPRRGLDHGAYVPLIAMYPEANVPVLQISLPGLIPEQLVALGRALAPLRDEGTLICGSGFLTHNMQYAFRPGTPAWAQEFDHWVEEALTRFDLDALMNFRMRAPSAAIALPTWEHYAPVLVTAGAAADEKPNVTFPITGWWMDGAFTKRSVQFG